jgi:hypothetical protein
MDLVRESAQWAGDLAADQGGWNMRKTMRDGRPFWRRKSHKRVGRTRPVHSIQIGDQYRALGVLQDDVVTWFWIGTTSASDF